MIGFRWSNDRQSLGSLLLGLYDENGTLHYLGHTLSFDAATRRRLLEQFMPMGIDPSPAMRGRMPGGPSHRSQGRETDWEAVRPELVCEVAFDKPPEQCKFDQIASAARFDVAEIFGAR